MGKTDYGRLGCGVMEHLYSSVQAADRVQKTRLLEMLEKNQDTEYGKKYGFSQIRSVSDYRKRVPLTDYSDYIPYIRRLIHGEQGILTRDRVIYFCVSSGTAGEPKYLPLTEADIRLYYAYAYGMIFGAAVRYYGGLPDDSIFGKIFQLGEFAKTTMEDGRMNGIRSASLFQWMDRGGEFDASDYCVPKEVLFPEKLEDLMYVKVRFALAERGLKAIHGVFANQLLRVMDYICKNWDMLLEDMEYGRVSPEAGVSKKWRDFLCAKLLPDPERSGELRQIPVKAFPERPGKEAEIPLIPALWPELKYVVAISGNSFPQYSGRLRAFVGEVPVYNFVYGASEGIFGVAETMNKTDAYLLFPEAGFFEFIPLDSPGGTKGETLLLHELSTGARYELVFTNYSGFYRYRMHDVIEVIGWRGHSPVVKFCYRDNLVINLAGEKTDQEQLENAMAGFIRLTGLTVNGFCVTDDSGALPSRYIVYLECDKKPGVRCAEVLDRCLCGSNYEYLGCRHMNEIGPLKLKTLPPGTFEAYEQRLNAAGRFTGQRKLLRILNSGEEKRYFAEKARERDGDIGK